MKRKPLPRDHRIAALMCPPERTYFVIRCDCGKQLVRATSPDAIAAHARHAAKASKRQAVHRRAS